MIEAADAQLKDWVTSVLGPTTTTLTAPGGVREGQGIGVYLLALDHAPPGSPANGAHRPPLQLQLNYLVTAWAEEPEVAHRMLGELAFGAMESTDFELALTPLTDAAWAALGAPPQPSFVLQVPLRRPRKDPDVPVVRQPLVVNTGPTTTLFGRVVVGDDTPIAGARVELPALHLSARTDSAGRFRFAGVPGESVAKHLRVLARGREFSVSVDRPTSEEEPVTIRLEWKGDG